MILNFCRCCIDWIDDHNGFIMCVITAVYVGATIAIMCFNKKSANAATEQLKEMKNQQEQNVGIQLYEKRKEIASNFNAEDYDKYNWDFMVLFPSNLYDEYINLGLKKQEINSLEIKKKLFEFRLSQTNSSDYNRYKDLKRYFNSEYDEYKTEKEEFFALCDKYVYTQFYKPDNCNVTFDMRVILNEIDVKTKLLSVQETKFSMRLKEYLKKSISAEDN